VIEPLLKGLKSRGALRSHVFAIIGPQTFSSEPVGEKLNGYGDVRPIELPNSHLSMQYSTKYFHLSRDGDEVLAPTVRASASLDDAMEGRDPALDAALRGR
jgi:hypothetical protein